uniref:Uncharacterized protein n=1 Tax=viral metagenome TaxID=1070528 RepID=A0A6C0LPY4_9ZZZZ
MNDITTIIERLPQELKTQIYKDYFEATIVYDDLKQIINSDQCKALYNIELADVLSKVLQNNIVVKYLCKHEKEFKFVYNMEVVLKPNSTVDYYNFASLWLFNLYFKDIMKNPVSLSIKTNMFNRVFTNHTTDTGNITIIQ